MDKESSTNTNGNAAGNPGEMQKQKTRTVKVCVKTSSLGTIVITPVLGKKARKAVRKAEGRYNARLEERVQECTGDWTMVHFADSRGISGLELKVFDGDECILEQDSLPTLDAAYLVGYAKALHEHGEVTPDNFDRYEDYCEGEPELYQFVARAKEPEEADFHAGMVREFWEKLQNGKIPEDDHFMIGLVHHISSHLGDSLQEKGDGNVAFLDGVGDPGGGEVTFEIEIPENEPFDIEKLHFFCESDWWDGNGALGKCGYLLEDCSDTSLELLEYDGQIYCRLEPDVDPFWSRNRETILVKANLKDFDPEQLCEDADDGEDSDGGKDDCDEDEEEEEEE